MPTTTRRPQRRRQRETRKPYWSNSWNTASKRFARKSHKTSDNTGNQAATTLDKTAPVRHVMTTRAVDSLIRRATNPTRPLPLWTQRLVNNAQQWRTHHTHLDHFEITTLTRAQIRQLDTIQAKRT